MTICISTGSLGIAFFFFYSSLFPCCVADLSLYTLYIAMADESQPQTRFLIRQPLALQWFDNGKLVKRREEERQAGRRIPLFIHSSFIFLSLKLAIAHSFINNRPL